MGASPSGWTFADAWVLAAIGIYGRPCTLVELIAAGEAINHAVLLEAEVEAALGKLAGSGLVRVYEEWTFELTDDGTSLWSGDGRDLQGHLRRVEEQLAAIEPVTTVLNFPEGVFDQALQA